MGSPSLVPVPCASYQPGPLMPTEAALITALNKPSCAGPLGAVRLALRPSCRTMAPLTLVCTSASSRSTVEHASPLPMPSARWSKVKQRPDREIMPARAKAIVTLGTRMRFRPEARAPEHSCRCKADSAECTATKADAHAVLFATHGPCKPSTYDTRPAAIGSPLDVTSKALTGSEAKTSTKSSLSMPTKTPISRCDATQCELSLREKASYARSRCRR